MAHLLTTKEMAPHVRSNEWTIYEAVKRGDFPLEPLRIGRKILWRTAEVERLLGLEAGALSEATS